MNSLNKQAQSSVQGWAAKPMLAKEYAMTTTSVSRSQLDLNVTVRFTREDGQMMILVMNDKAARNLKASLAQLIPADPARAAAVERQSL